MEVPSARLLIVDDEPIVREALGVFLRDKGYQVDLAPSGQSALELAAQHSYQLAIVDIRMPDLNGIAVLRELKVRRPELPVLMMTAYAEVSTAVSAMKAGAYDYIIKPFEPETVALVVRNVVAHQMLKWENSLLRQKLEERERFDELVGNSTPMQTVFELIAGVGATDVAVLIHGAAGTGKELVARAIHRRSLRANGPFVVVNCSSLPEPLLEAELFGHEPGAPGAGATRQRGRLELASGGTLFLDEVAALGPQLQIALLRALESKSVTAISGNLGRPIDVRVVAATRRDLAAEVRTGWLREDLYYLLRGVTIELPPLCARKEDLPALANQLLEHFAHTLGRSLKGFSSEAMTRMFAYDWPGNVRELSSVVEHAVAICRDAWIQPVDLPAHLQTTSDTVAERTLEAVERRHIIAVLDETQWNVTRAATILGIDRVTLHKKVKRYALRRPDADRRHSASDSANVEADASATKRVAKR